MSDLRQIEILVTLLPVLLLVLVLAGFVAFMRRSVGPEEWARAQRPWWGNPLLWLAISGAFVILGLTVARQFLGFTFLFLPFLWIGGKRWVPRGSACPSCGRPLHPEHDFCPRCGTRVAR